MRWERRGDRQQAESAGSHAGRRRTAWRIERRLICMQSGTPLSATSGIAEAMVFECGGPRGRCSVSCGCPLGRVAAPLGLWLSSWACGSPLGPAALPWACGSPLGPATHSRVLRLPWRTPALLLMARSHPFAWMLRCALGPVELAVVKGTGRGTWQPAGPRGPWAALSRKLCRLHLAGHSACSGAHLPRSACHALRGCLCTTAPRSWGPPGTRRASLLTSAHCSTGQSPPDAHRG